MAEALVRACSASRPTRSCAPARATCFATSAAIPSRGPKPRITEGGTRPEPRGDGRRSGSAALGLVRSDRGRLAPAFRAGWVWDDDSYVTANATLRTRGRPSPHLDGAGRRRAVLPAHLHDALARLSSPRARPRSRYHATSTSRCTRRAAVVLGSRRVGWRLRRHGAVAALFAVHPMHVESGRMGDRAEERAPAALSARVPGCSSGGGSDARRQRRRSGALVARFALRRASSARSSSRRWRRRCPVVFLVVRGGAPARVATRDDRRQWLPFVALRTRRRQRHRVASSARHVGAVGSCWNQTPPERLLIAGPALVVLRRRSSSCRGRSSSSTRAGRSTSARPAQWLFRRRGRESPDRAPALQSAPRTRGPVARRRSRAPDDARARRSDFVNVYPDALLVRRRPLRATSRAFQFLALAVRAARRSLAAARSHRRVHRRRHGRAAGSRRPGAAASAFRDGPALWRGHAREEPERDDRVPEPWLRSYRAGTGGAR